MKTLIVAVALLLLGATGGCANVKYTLRDQGKAGEDIHVSYSGTSYGAKDLVDAATRRRDSMNAGDVAAESVKKGLPAAVHTAPKTTSTTAGGYGYFPYGAYGTYGGYGAYRLSQGSALSEAASLGYGPGMLPTLGDPPVYTQPAPQPVLTLPSAPSAGTPQTKVGCPPDRDPVSIEERTACFEQNVRVIARKVYKR